MAADIIHFLAAAIAWSFALAFIQMKRRWISVDSIIFALLCVIITFLIERTDYGRWIPLIELALFLLFMVIVYFQIKRGYGDSVLAFLLAQGNFSLFAFLNDRGYSSTGITALLISVILMGVTVFLAVMLQKRFPEKNWRDYYRQDKSEPERMNLRLFHVYLVAAVIGVLPTAGRIVLHPIGLSDTFVWTLFGVCLFWLGVFLILLINAYKKERFTVLIEQQYRTEMQSFLNVIRSQRHDYNFHVQTIAGLIEAGKYEECRSYVNALVKDSKEMNAILPLSDPAIAATINTFQVTAAQEGIELHIDIQNNLSQIASNVYETNKIISNLLQNAIDETAQHKDKSFGIWLTILKRGEYCVIRVSNELETQVLSADELGQLYQQGYTTKTGHEGVGLSSVRLLVSKYNGMIYTQLDGNIISFIAKIPINYTKISAGNEEEN